MAVSMTTCISMDGTNVSEKAAIFICVDVHQGLHKSWQPNRRGHYFFTVAPNICGSSVRNVLLVNILAPRILRWLLDFWKMCAPLIWIADSSEKLVHIDQTTVSFIHSVFCLTIRPLPLPKRVLHRMRSGASSFSFRYFLLFLRSSSSCLRLLPCVSYLRR
jgi:hypothetical protein